MPKFFVTKQTANALSGSNQLTILTGGYEGYENYGDILQLQGVIESHRAKSTRHLVLVVEPPATIDFDEFDERMKSQFGIDHVVFGFHADFESTPANAVPLPESLGAEVLHVYGGGYLNQFWGIPRMTTIGQIVGLFRPRMSVFTGLQIDSSVLLRLRTLLNSAQPTFVGARDDQSYRLLQLIWPTEKIRFTSDDAFDIIDRLTKKFRRLSFFRKRAGTFAFHANYTAEYTEITLQQQRIVDTLTAARMANPSLRVRPISGYLDDRGIVKDTLEAISELNFGTSLRFEPGANFVSAAQSVRINWPQSVRVVQTGLRDTKFVLSSSYHVALTFLAAGIPAYLIAENPYYSQKRETLGLESSIDLFLKSPTVGDFSLRAERRKRQRWNREFESWLTL